MRGKPRAGEEKEKRKHTAAIATPLSHAVHLVLSVEHATHSHLGRLTVQDHHMTPGGLSGRLETLLQPVDAHNDEDGATAEERAKQ